MSFYTKIKVSCIDAAKCLGGYDYCRFVQWINERGATCDEGEDKAYPRCVLYEEDLSLKRRCDVMRCSKCLEAEREDLE